MDRWIATVTRHLGLAAGDKDVPCDPERFRRQMIRVAAVAVAAVEFSLLANTPATVEKVAGAHESRSGF